MDSFTFHCLLNFGRGVIVTLAVEFVVIITVALRQAKKDKQKRQDKDENENK